MADPDVTVTGAGSHKPERDPIKASYDVFIKPRISGNRQIHVLQFPNRLSSQHYSQDNATEPQRLRLKPESGMVEVDVPIDPFENFDREKGVRWGDAVKKSTATKGRGTHGLPGGFGIGSAQPSGRGRGRVDVDDESVQERALSDFAGAVQRDQVLKTQTLGGQYVTNDETSPQYMIGVWRGDQLHLTPADQVAQLRPQFHHIDAQSEQEHQSRVRDLTAAPPRPTEARAIHMTVKASIDGEEDTTDNMVERIAATQQEAWNHLRFVDEESTDAWEAFGENLFVSEEVLEKQALREQARNLSSGFEDVDLLDTISATRDEAKLSRTKAAANRAEKKEDDESTDGDHSDASGPEGE